MSLWNAELAKIALNTFITTKISLANTYAMVCNRMPQGDVDAITKFLGLDSRIGSKYLKGGLGFSGECFPRDNRAFYAFAKKLDIDVPIQKATEKVNKAVVSSVIQKVSRLLNKDSTVSILGLTFKPNTDVITESQSLDIARILSAKYKVKVYDPMGINNAKKMLDSQVEYHEDIAHCIFKSDLCIVATAWDEFKHIDGRVFKELMSNPVVLDCWRMLDKESLVQRGVKYYALGVNDGN
jgi:UDPglucose 6-dehydrogenase